MRKRGLRISIILVALVVICFGTVLIAAPYTPDNDERSVIPTKPNSKLIPVPAPYDTERLATDRALTLSAANNQLVVSIGLDGHVTFGPGYTADDVTSRKFWELVGAQYPNVCRPLSPIPDSYTIWSK